MAEPVSQYLERYAEPEARLAARVEQRYGYALVVPAYDEPLALLTGYEAAARAALGRVLLILVVNAPEDAPADARATTDALWRALTALPGHVLDEQLPHVRLCHAAAFDVLAVDRFQGARSPSRREGVGLARRAGMDLALALWHLKKLDCRLVGSTDADVRLPEDYFSALGAAASEYGPGELAALLFPFQHVASGDASIDAATWLYEAGLRYYVLGLRAAGSPYAHHSIGSTFAIDASSYARVRGFPKRAAGEDFYLLDKLVKLAPLGHARAGAVEIRARRSERVPFGTGRSALAIAASGEPNVYHPDTFRALGAFLRGLDAFAADAQPTHVQAALAEDVPDLAEVTLRLLGDELTSALREAAAQAPAGAQLRRRVHTWFDALRTLQLIHGLRDAARPSLPLRGALARARFVTGLGDPLAPDELCARLAALEQSAPAADSRLA